MDDRTMFDPGTVDVTRDRVEAPEPGERCSCGRPAVVVYALSDGRRVAFCGVTVA